VWVQIPPAPLAGRRPYSCGMPSNRSAAGERARPGRPSGGETYRLTLAAGFEAIVERALRADLPAATVTKRESGSLLVHAASRLAPAIAALPYVAMSLLELSRTDQGSLDQAVISLSARLHSLAVPRHLDPMKGFRIRVSDEGLLVSIGPRARMAIQDSISRWCGARPDARGGGLEFWVIRRRGDRYVSLSLRLDGGPAAKVARGELKPDLAAALVRTVPVRSSDVFYDPFAGRGAIPKARARYPAAELLASDLAPEPVSQLRRLRQRGKLGPNARVGRVDAASASEVATFADGCLVDTVITDPPWGIFDRDLADLDTLYLRACTAIRAIVASPARVVMLTAAADAAQSALAASAFTVSETTSVLVNGRKATVIEASA
jgi:23S rRNA G2445 N2-methylase RlmL